MADDVLLKDDNIPPIQEELFKLYSQGFVTDITLSCEDGKIFEAHKVILSARSSYFYNLIPRLKGDPVIFLKGIKGTYLEKILKFVYSGSASVSKTQLRPLFDVARALHIKGLLELAASELKNTLGQYSPSSATGSARTFKNTSSHGTSKYDVDRFKKPTGANDAREIVLQQQQKLYEKFSTFKGRSSLRSSGSQSSAELSAKSSPGKRASRTLAGGSGKSLQDNDKSEQHDKEVFNFKYKHISDDSDDADVNGDDEQGVPYSSKLSKKSSKYVEPPRRKRGRPSKHSSATLQSAAQRKGLRNDSKSSTEDSDSSDDDTRSKKDESGSTDSDSDSELDNSDLDSLDDSDGGLRSPSRSKVIENRKKEPSPSLDDYFDIPERKPPQRRSNRDVGVNGKSVLTVQCKGKRAELHIKKFCNGWRGKSILYKNQWHTPEEYEKACGEKNKKYLDTITTDYGPLKTLTVSGYLKLHTKKCKCSDCQDDDPELESKRENDRLSGKSAERTETSTSASKKENSGNDETDGQPSEKRRKTDHIEDANHKSACGGDPPEAGKGDNASVSSKLSQPSPVADHRQATEGGQPVTRTSASSSVLPKQENIVSVSTVSATQSPSPVTCTASKQLPSPSLGSRTNDILSPPTLTNTQTTNTAHKNAITTSSFSTPPADWNLAQQPQQHTFITFTTKSPTTQLTTTCTTTPGGFGSSLITFPALQPLVSLPSVSPAAVGHKSVPSQLVSHASTGNNTTSSTAGSSETSANHLVTSVALPQNSHAVATISQQLPTAVMKPQYIQMAASPKTEPSNNILTPVSGGLNVAVAQHQMASYPSMHQPRSRLGSVMQVKCKALTGLLYVNNYESGSKGKCILLGDEWLTPNEFEEKSGSKAKKYLSSIKCLDRPLRAFVSSGELRGAGPPPSPKVQQLSRPKAPQPIAPAPPSHSQSAPPPPQAVGHAIGLSNVSAHSHLAGTSSVAATIHHQQHAQQQQQQQTLGPVAMMSSVSLGQPILINQTGGYSTAGTTVHHQNQAPLAAPILAPMTFTLAPMNAATGVNVDPDESPGNILGL